MAALPRDHRHWAPPVRVIPDIPGLCVEISAPRDRIGGMSTHHSPSNIAKPLERADDHPRGGPVEAAT